MSSKKARRVTVDTTVIVGAFIARQGFPAQVLRSWHEYAFTLVVSQPIIEEYVDVLSRPKTVNPCRLEREEATDFLEDIRRNAELVALPPDYELPMRCRDPKGDLFLTCSLSGKCDYLVTGDRDLLALENHAALGKLRIVTPREFTDTVL